MKANAYSAPEIQEKCYLEPNEIDCNLSTVDAYSWGMVFYGYITERSEDDLDNKIINNLNDWNDWKKINNSVVGEINHLFIVEKGKDYMEESKKKIFKEVLNDALQYNPKNRANMIEIVKKIVKLEKENNIEVDPIGPIKENNIKLMQLLILDSGNPVDFVYKLNNCSYEEEKSHLLYNI